MRKYSDNTGVSLTCPKIDSVLNFIGSIEWDETEEDLENGAIEASKTLEEIRKMNSELRDFGNKHYEELQEMEKDRDYYEKKCKQLEDEVKYLEKQLSEAEN